MFVCICVQFCTLYFTHENVMIHLCNCINYNQCAATFVYGRECAQAFNWSELHSYHALLMGSISVYFFGGGE